MAAGGDEARAGGAEGVPHRQGAAPGIEACAVDLSDGVFRKAAKGFRKRFPDLAARFEIENAIATTDRVEAELENDGGTGD